MRRRDHPHIQRNFVITANPLHFFSCNTRSNFACNARGMSPISSRKTVPPSADSSNPRRCADAPVNAPFSWPNNSLSNSASGIAAQFTAANTPFARGPFW